MLARATTSRLASIRSVEIENSTSDYDREKLEERLAKLSGGVAKGQRGRAATESEMKEKKARVECPSRDSPRGEGILPGGGVAAPCLGRRGQCRCQRLLG
ncbi:MAG: hypothetical protein R3B96_24510 [Pirellulaceae bacterium]